MDWRRKRLSQKLLWLMPVRYDSLTLSLEQLGNMRSLSIEEVIFFFFEKESRSPKSVTCYTKRDKSNKANKVAPHVPSLL